MKCDGCGRDGEQQHMVGLNGRWYHVVGCFDSGLKKVTAPLKQFRDLMKKPSVGRRDV